jgi:hypothetical protein
MMRGFLGGPRLVPYPGPQTQSRNRCTLPWSTAARTTSRTVRDWKEEIIAKHLRYWDYDRDAVISCDCGWNGPAAGNEETYSQLLDVHCPRCQRMLLIVSFPTVGETREAAAAGNE